MEDTVRTIWPFYLVMVVTLLLVIYIPVISMFLPNLLLGRFRQAKMFLSGRLSEAARILSSYFPTKLLQ